MTSLLDTLPQTRMRSLVTGQQHEEWRALRDAYAAALADHEQQDTERTSEAEQQALDSWADWVEENNLNYTVYDPRGRTDPHEDDASVEWAKTVKPGDQLLMSRRPTGRRWTVQTVADDGSSIVLVRHHTALRLTHRRASGTTLVTMMKANGH